MALVHAAGSWSGIVLINKPQQATSFSMISLLRRLSGIRRIGHIGTLDPFADGLLPVCIDRAAAAVSFMEDFDKTYHVQVAFGAATDTQDLTGQVIATHQLSEEERAHLQITDFADLRQAVAALVGEQQQVPPMYSAVKKDGRPLYQYARSGQTVERKSRTITVRNARLLDVSLADHLQATILIHCSKGTYIRTLADELGRKLGYYAHARALTRTQCGPFLLSQAICPDELERFRQAAAPEELAGRLRQEGLLLPIAAAFTGWPQLHLQQEDALRLIQGQRVFADASVTDAQDEKGRFAVLYNNYLLAIARLRPDSENRQLVKTERVFLDRADFQRL